VPARKTLPQHTGTSCRGHRATPATHHFALTRRRLAVC
ncbi:hypothetical protein pipiens_005188, partial [Culex pipiens pipiens]